MPTHPPLLYTWVPKLISGSKPPLKTSKKQSSLSTQIDGSEYYRHPPVAPKPIRFPRIAVKSKDTGNERVVRETEKVVGEKVLQQRTEELPDGGLRTVEYVEKVIETEVSERIRQLMADESCLLFGLQCCIFLSVFC